MEYTVTFHRDKDTKFCEIPRFTFPESDESHSDQKNEDSVQVFTFFVKHVTD